MEDAEYVDSLQIDNLVAHPNGTADINLNIGLDENNKLNAEMIDPETGATSNANVTLVSRTLEERLEPTNYDVKLENNPQENPKEESLDDLLNNSETETSENNSADDFSELPEFDEENFDIPDFEENSDETIVENPISEETFSEDKNGNIIEDSEEKQQDNPETAKNNETKAEEFELPEFPEENPLEEPVETDTENTETQAQEFSDEDFEIPDFDEVAPADEEISVPVTEESKEAETETEIPDFDSEENKAPETEDSTETEEKSEDSKSGAVAAGAVAGAGAALGLLGAASLLKKKEEEKSEKTEITAENSDSTVVADTNDSPFDDFQLPDFDTDSNSEPETDEKSVLDDDAFFDSITSDDEKSGKTENSEDASTLVNDNTPSNGINFDGLYDKETVAGDSSDSTYENESEEIKKKTKAPVIICIICAIICILATLLILFVVPSKYNLLNKNDKAKTEQTLEIQEEPEQEISELPAEEPEQKPVVIESKEEEVVVAPEPEQVIPETPKEPETKPADITYKIKWGDTLWDIADSYYKNPWNYKKIARYNNIKNPDYIISGTTITIPAK